MLDLSIVAQHPIFSLVIFCLLALAIGSFLNVVIYRLPIIVNTKWENTSTSEKQDLSLHYPASHCPQCKEPLQFWHNIPLISYLVLQGKCSFCDTTINVRYPIVEATTVLLSIIVAITLGPDWKTAVGIVLTWLLIVMAVIDLETMTLPDELTLFTLWGGLIMSTGEWFTTPVLAISGAVVGYLIFWTLNQIYFLITKKQGMGYGDMKLVAALGAWFGLYSLPFIILFASMTGLLIAIMMYLFKKMNFSDQISFGPYLCLSGWLFLVMDAPSLPVLNMMRSMP